jgi:hypothetical protein
LSTAGLAKPRIGPLFPWVRLASYVELALFAALLFFWLAPGYESQEFWFGLSHGIGVIALCLFILVGVLRRELPWPLLGAAVILGPVGSSIGVELIRRRGLGVA